MFWDSWFGTVKENRTQLYFPDYGGFKFRRLPLEDSCLVEKDKNKQVTKAWPHFYSAQIPFGGHKNIHAGMVTLSFDRDFILDPFNVIPITTNSSGKPEKSDVSIKKWTAQIAESQRYKVMSQPGNMMLIEKITLWLGVALILLILIFGIQQVSG